MVRETRFPMVWEESAKSMVLVKPYRATHAILQTDEGKKAMVDVEDLDTLAGTSGQLKWMRLTKNHREVLGEIKFDGKIDQIKSDYRKSKRTG